LRFRYEEHTEILAKKPTTGSWHLARVAGHPLSHPKYEEPPMKFLVLWHFDISRLTPEVVRAITEQPKYGEKLEKEGKLECRYHVVGSHGGAWIYKVDSNEELDRLLAMSPVFNFATYQVLTLAEMRDPLTVVAKAN
jgi:muconolactone delta-isomerase